MKVLKYILGLSFVLALFTACDGEAEGAVYTPAEDGLSFASSLQKQALTAEDAGVVRVPVYRSLTAEAVDVPVTITYGSAEASEIFVPESDVVSFKSGEAVAYLEFNFESVDKLSPAGAYKISVSFAEDAPIAASGISKINLTLNRQLTFAKFKSGVGQISSSFFGEAWECEVEVAKEAPIFKFKELYIEGYDILVEMDEKFEKVVSVAAQETGYLHPSYGMVSVRYSDSAVNGREIKLLLNFFVSAGTFGNKLEVITLPE